MAAQVALSMTLLVVAGLLTNSLTRLLAVHPGYDYERVALASLMVSPTRYPDGAARVEFLTRLEQELETHPEIQSVTVITGSGFSFGEELEAEGGEPRTDQPQLIPFAAVAEDYFSTIGMRLVSGRSLGQDDRESDNVIVNEELARFLWGPGNAVGRRFRYGDDADWMTVVGVAQELRLMGRDDRSGPYQFLRARGSDSAGQYAEVAMRTRADPRDLVPVFRETLRTVDPEQWVWKLRTAAQALAEEEDQPRFLVTLMGLLAAIAVTLAAVGLYGVLAYSVGRRSRELGIRMALGADRYGLRTKVLGEGFVVAGVGVAIGIGGALLVSRTVEGLLFDLDGHDPATFVVAALVLLTVAMVASYLPARRATQVDPVQVLNAE